jgi:hypothetical protein
VLDIIATALLASCGLILLIGFESVALKIAGAIVAVVPAFGASVFHCFRNFAFNTLYFKPAIGLGIYNYNTAWMALAGSLCEAVFFLVITFFFYRAWKRRSKKALAVRSGR